jgi:hypothetical protein
MRLRIPLHGLLCSIAVVLLGSWLAVTTVGVAGAAGFQLQVPASYLSAGQQFQPRLVSLAASAAAPSTAITLELSDAKGRRLATQRVSLEAMASVFGAPWALPRPGDYTLRARTRHANESIVLHALPEPDAAYGGVLAVAAAGLPAGAADYLRQHGFAVTLMNGIAPPDPPGLIVIGDSRLDGDALAMQYRWIWRQVARGAQALLLEPPAAGAEAYWPPIAPLAFRARPCAPAPGADAPLYYDLHPGAALNALLSPGLAYRLSAAAAGLFAWNGAPLAEPDGCHAVVSLRYGRGWITASTLPLLQRFQDVRARILLMNLIKATMLRKRMERSADALAAATARRLAMLPETDPAAEQAVFFRPPAATIAAALALIPLAGGACWRAPLMLRPGGSLRLDLRRPQPVRQLTLRFGPGGDGRPVAFTLAASPDGVHWTQLADPPAAGRTLSLPVPAGVWRAFQLSLPVPNSGWQLCGFAAQ